MDDNKEIKATAYFSQDAFDAFMRGDAVDNNGFRSLNGTFYPDQPRFDFESDDEDDEDEEDDHYYDSDMNEIDDELEAGDVLLGVAILAAIVGAVHYGPKIWKWAKSKFSKKTAEEEQSNQNADNQENKEDSTQETPNSSEQNNDNTETVNMTLKYTSSDFEERLQETIQEYRDNPDDEGCIRHLLNAMQCIHLASEEIKQYTEEYIEVHPEYHANIEGWKDLINRYTAMNVKSYLDYLVAQKEETPSTEMSTDELKELLGSSDDHEQKMEMGYKK